MSRLFWLDQIAEEIVSGAESKEIIISAGWALSGTIHLGNLRADGVIPVALGNILRRKGFEARNIVVVYDQDRFKATRGQLLWFVDEKEASKRRGVPENFKPPEDLTRELRGRRLRDVPDPLGCCRSWSEHWLAEVKGNFKRMGIESLEPIRTSDFYRSRKGREGVKKIIENRGDVVKIMNKYRKRNPYSENWIPFEPWCPNCMNIADNTALEVDLKSYRVRMLCSKCGYQGWSPMQEGKLNWRVEWATLWAELEITVEPFGKDHATPGGSRDNSAELIREIFNKKPPYGFWCEWIGKIEDGEDLGDMTGSGNIGYSSTDYLEIGEPEALRFLYLAHDPKRRFAWDFQNIYRYHDEFDQAERVYYGEEEIEGKRKKDIVRGYELALLDAPQKKKPFQLDYRFAAIISQVVKERENIGEVIGILRKSGLLKKELSDYEEKRIRRRIKLAYNWAKKYAPPQYKITPLKQLKKKIIDGLSEKQKDALQGLAEKLRNKTYGLDELNYQLFEIAKEHGLTYREFFQSAYLVLLGKKQGPRLSRLLLTFDKEWIINRLKLNG